MGLGVETTPSFRHLAIGYRGDGNGALVVEFVDGEGPEGPGVHSWIRFSLRSQPRFLNDMPWAPPQPSPRLSDNSKKKAGTGVITHALRHGDNGSSQTFCSLSRAGIEGPSWVEA